MSKFRNLSNGVEVSVSDEKDARFVDGWVLASEPVSDSSDEVRRGPGRPKKSDK